MLLYLFDRVGSTISAYALAAWITWSVRDYTHLSIVYGILAVLSVFCLKSLVTAVSRESKLARLGARAPSYRTWTPWNLGFVYSAVWHMLRHRNHEFWWHIFSTVRGATASGSQWTMETIMMGERIVFTADEENIKAILATQFGSYGKGPQFRKEWKDFLGLSMLKALRAQVLPPVLTILSRHLHH